MKSSVKNSEIEKALDQISLKMFGKSRSEAIRQDICVNCGGEASEFDDAISAKEFSISGMCQVCQNDFFNSIEDNDNG